MLLIRRLQKLLGDARKFQHLRNVLEHFKSTKDLAGALRTIEEMVGAGVSRELLALEKCKIAYESGQFYDVVAEAMGKNVGSLAT